MTASQTPNNSDTRMLLRFEDNAVVDSAIGSLADKTFTVGGTITNADAKFGSQSLLCYGVSNNLKVSASIDWNFGTTAWVLDAWFKFIDGEPFTFGWWKDKDNHLGLALHRYTSGPAATAVHSIQYKLNGVDMIVPDFPSGGSWLSGVWHHIAIARTGGGLTFYQGGNYKKGWNFAGPSADRASVRVDVGSWPLYIGRSPRFGADELGDFHGYVDEVRVHNNVLISSGVTAGVNYDLPTDRYGTVTLSQGIGTHNIYEPRGSSAAGQYLLGGTGVRLAGIGAHNIYEPRTSVGSGEHNIFTAGYSQGELGKSSLGLTTPAMYKTRRRSTGGSHSIYDARTRSDAGKYVILTITATNDGVGSYIIRRQETNDGVGRSTVRTLTLTDGLGLHAIKSSGSKYHLYHAAGSPPDLTAAAFETFDTLPHTTAVLSGAGLHYFILRERNSFGLFSQNITMTIIELDGSDNEIALAPSPPDTYSLVPNTNGTVIQKAEYSYPKDGANAADEWVLYTTTNGVDPDPNTDTPFVTPMIKADGIAKLALVSSVLPDGFTVKLLARTRKNGGRESTNTSPIAQTTAATGGPAAPSLTVVQTVARKGVKIV